MRKIMKYVLPILFLLAVAGIIWVVFFVFDFVVEPEKRITGIVTILGLGFGVFQFWIAEINIRLRRISELKQNEYHQIFLIVESIPDLLNVEMMKEQINNPHGLVSTLMNQFNRLSSIIRVNKDFLFPGIFDSKESQEMKEVLEEIIRRTDKFKQSMEKDNASTMENTVEKVELINWHNDMKESLETYHSVKHAFYKKLRSYK